MKRLLILTLFISYVIHGQVPQQTSYQIELQKSIDYYSVSLFNKAKENLIQLLYSGIDSVDEAEIRYHLGLCSYYEGKKNSAIQQWEKMASKYPNHQRSKEVRNFVQSYIKEKEDIFNSEIENIEFIAELEHGLRFWTPIAANEKLFWGDLKEPLTALKYYSELFSKYEEPNKQFKILYFRFRLLGGFNQDNFGYKNSPKSGQLAQNTYRSESQQLLEKLETLVKDKNDPNYGLLIQANYLWALKLSDSKLFGRVKTNGFSKEYFNKVISLTDHQPTNIYRTFSQHWLKVAN